MTELEIIVASLFGLAVLVTLVVFWIQSNRWHAEDLVDEKTKQLMKETETNTPREAYEKLKANMIINAKRSAEERKSVEIKSVEDAYEAEKRILAKFEPIFDGLEEKPDQISLVFPSRLLYRYKTDRALSDITLSAEDHELCFRIVDLTVDCKESDENGEGVTYKKVSDMPRLAIDIADFLDEHMDIMKVYTY